MLVHRNASTLKRHAGGAAVRYQPLQRGAVRSGKNWVVTYRVGPRFFRVTYFPSGHYSTVSGKVAPSLLRSHPNAGFAGAVLSAFTHSSLAGAVSHALSTIARTGGGAFGALPAPVIPVTLLLFALLLIVGGYSLRTLAVARQG